MAVLTPVGVVETTTTTGTGTYSLAGAVTGYTLHGVTWNFRTFIAAVGNGNQCYYHCRAGSEYEEGVGTVASGTPNTLARTSVLSSSNGGAAVNWGAGTRVIFVGFPSTGLLLPANNLSEIASASTARTNLGAGAVGSSVFTSSTAAEALAALGVLPASQTGGTDGKVVRLTTTANTWQDASQADTAAQLASVAFKGGGRYYQPGAVITGLSGLTAGTVYYLSTAGALTSTAPTPTASLRRLVVGIAVSTTALLFQPGIPIGA